MPDSKPGGRESPSPARQSGKQQHDPPGSGQGTGDKDSQKKNLEDQVKNLESNPKGPIDDSLEHKFSKEPGN